MTSNHSQSSKDIAELARWLWPGGMHLDWDGRVAIRPPLAEAWISFDPLRNPSDCAKAWPILESRGRIGHLVREMEVQLRKLRCVKHHPVRRPSTSMWSGEAKAHRQDRPARTISSVEMLALKQFWNRLSELKEEEALLTQLQATLALLGFVGFKERHFPPGTTNPDDHRVRVFRLIGKRARSMRLLSLISKLPPLRGKLVFFGAVLGAQTEDVSRFAGIREGDSEEELQAGVAEVKTQLLQWHGLNWFGKGLDFGTEEADWKGPRVDDRRPQESQTKTPGAPKTEETYAPILKGILDRLGGGPNLSGLVAQHLFRIPSRLQRVLLLRHLSGFHPSIIGHHLRLSTEQVELELLHGRQLLEEQLLESPTLRPLLAQTVAALLVVSRDARGEGRAEKEMEREE